MKGFSWGMAEIAAHNRRVLGGSFSQPQESEVPASASANSERELHDDILEYCKVNRWIALHGRMDERTGRTPGEPDFTIMADRGRVFFFECKSKTGKLSEDQMLLIKHAEMNGHAINVIRSMDEFTHFVT